MHKVNMSGARESYGTASVVDGILLPFSRGNRDLLRGLFVRIVVVSGPYSGDESIVGVDAGSLRRVMKLRVWSFWSF
jgi:hypothetical protein